MVTVAEYTELCIDGRHGYISGSNERDYLTMQIARQKVADILMNARNSPNWKVRIIRAGTVWVVFNDTVSLHISIWDNN